MATSSRRSAQASDSDNVAGALLEEYLALGTFTSRAAATAALKALQDYKARSREPAEVADWLRANQDLLELVYKSIHDLPARSRPTALCLSGGGIRSATFSLGVLQGLARLDWLDKFRYLSSVSGGGYIASWLSALRRQPGADLANVKVMLADTAGGIARPAPPLVLREPLTGSQHDAVSRLRAYSNYLSPVLGLSGDMLALVATFLRNLLMNLCVWLPLIAGLLLLPRVFVLALLAEPAAEWVAGLGAVACLLLAGGVAYMIADLPADQHPEFPPRDRFAAGCFLPVVTSAFLFSLIGVWGQYWSNGPWWPGVAAAVGAGANLVGIILGLLYRSYRQPDAPLRGIFVGAVLLVACGAFGGIALDLALVYAHKQFGKADDPALLYATVSLPLMLSCFWGQITLCAGVTTRWIDENMREWWGRASGLWLRLILGWSALFVVVLYLPPLAITMLGTTLPAGAQLSAGGIVAGVLTSAIGYWSKNGDNLTKRGAGLLARWGNLFLNAIAGAVLLALLVAMSLGVSQLLQNCGPFAIGGVCDNRLADQATFLREEQQVAQDVRPVAGEAAVYDFVALHASLPHALMLFGLCTFVGAALSAAIGANAFSLHGMYGNRLVRAYLGAARKKRNPHWLTGFDRVDNFPLSRLATCDRLFPVINIALNLVQPTSAKMAWQQRKAASFTATPLHCGSVGTGYVRTEVYGGPRGMSLGRAMTISGAAASPNMGYHSSPLVTLVMTLFNVRLGWWMANPKRQFLGFWQRKEFPGLDAMASEAFGLTTDDRRSVYLSDGGHFENLGLYEMVRRRCHRIVVIDASCDPRYEYEDLLGAVRKIRIDFGVDIELPRTLPGQPGALRSRRVAVGRIRYSLRDEHERGKRIDGWLYLVKPVLTGKEPLDLGDYARSARPGEGPFPHQSTADQFFNEAQFESYRMLGLQSALDVFAHPLASMLSKPARRARKPYRFGAAEEPKDTIPEPSPSSQAAPSGVAGFVHSVGPGVALATALSVGGTVGVVGTVKLSSGSVSLSPEDRQLLKEGLTAKGSFAATVSPAASVPLVLDPGAQVYLDAHTLDALDKAIEAARDAAAAAEAAAKAKGQAGPAGKDGGVAPTGPASVSITDASINNLVRELRGAAVPAAPPASGTVEANLAEVVKSLRQIDMDLTQITPRRVGNAAGRQP